MLEFETFITIGMGVIIALLWEARRYLTKIHHILFEMNEPR